MLSEATITRAFEAARLPLRAVERKSYPDEVFWVLHVDATDFMSASNLAQELEAEHGDENTFVTVRSRKAVDPVTARPLADGVHDERVSQLINLLNARSKVSQTQPSLTYIRDAAENISAAAAPRHSLIFGRRGAGKTSLLVESQRVVEAAGNEVIWLNLQTYRHEAIERTFLYFLEELMSCIVGSPGTPPALGGLKDRARRITANCQALLADSFVRADSVQRLIPSVNRIVRQFTALTGTSVYVYLDDLYFIARDEQPLLLDYMASIGKDASLWLKVASIRNLTRWFQSSPPLGLETRHDAPEINLDVTLQDPRSAKDFLEQVLTAYCGHVGIDLVSKLFSRPARDRMVIASGAVPRDYLLLAASSIQTARRREMAKLVGVQDVNNAAGRAADTKLRELDDDVSANEFLAQWTVQALRAVSRFCLDQEKWTVFRVDFRAKDDKPSRYAALIQLMDLRLIHLIEPSLSDERTAGEKSEAYLLDISQYTGQRLKKKLFVLDLVNGDMALKETGVKATDRVATTSAGRVGLLRRAPLLPMDELPALPPRT